MNPDIYKTIAGLIPGPAAAIDGELAGGQRYAG
jgi:hypothetical protein